MFSLRLNCSVFYIKINKLQFLGSPLEKLEKLPRVLQFRTFLSCLLSTPALAAFFLFSRFLPSSLSLVVLNGKGFTSSSTLDWFLVKSNLTREIGPMLKIGHLSGFAEHSRNKTLCLQQKQHLSYSIFIHSSLSHSLRWQSRCRSTHTSARIVNCTCSGELYIRTACTNYMNWIVYSTVLGELYIATLDWNWRNWWARKHPRFGAFRISWILFAGHR